MLRSLLKDFLIMVALLAASLVLPVAGFWMCRSEIGILRGTGWMFFGLLASYGWELAVVFLLPPSRASRDLFPRFAYAPALLALWSAALG